MVLDQALIKSRYTQLNDWMQSKRPLIPRALTLSEKLLLSHLDASCGHNLQRGIDWALFRPDRVALQDVTAQMTLLQFMLAGLQSTHVPTSVHCDHLIQAETGAHEDLQRAQTESREVFDFLKSSCCHYGIDFWQPGSGIIHQVVLENYAFPGGMMLGTDSHTPNAGGLGMIAIGVGGADGVDVMAGMPWEVKMPSIIGVKLTGTLSGWTSGKDIILKVASLLTVKGGTGHIIEYFGPGARTLSCTGKATICNMGAEVGATCSLFPYDEKMSQYLHATGRGEVAKLADAQAHHLCADEEVEKSPEDYYDRVIQIDLDQLGPHVNGPYTPDLAWPLAELAEAVAAHHYPDKIHVALIGSCTNSSYEDMERAASIALQAKKAGISCKCPLTITPGSDQIFETMKRDGLLSALEAVGAQVLANACGPCIGQWKRHDIAPGEVNTIITSFNRNFSGRNDANPGTHNFVTSPEMVLAFALSGSLSFNPLIDELNTPQGPLKLVPPTGHELPPHGFVADLKGYIPGKADPTLPILIEANSNRLAALEPFKSLGTHNLFKLRVLLKARGKCTTDHISPAGSWLRFRGHLDRISDNLFSGAINYFRDETGKGLNLLSGHIEPFSQVARSYQAAGVNWVAIGDENYGEGSSREHAAMEPRHLGAVAIIAKSFARIHETNLKKQGLLPLTFVRTEDYDNIREDDWLDLLGLDSLIRGSPLTLVAHHSDGQKSSMQLQHSLNEGQILWFKAGSALNLIGKSLGEGAT